MRRFIGLGLALALLAGGCGGGSPTSEGSPTPTVTEVPTTTTAPTTTSTAPTATAAPTTATAAPTTTTTTPAEEPTATTTTVVEEPPETTTTTTEAPILLTDSFRGVTSETIRVGFTSIDFEKFNSTYGFNLTYANYEPAVDTYVAHVNATGGILGRMIEVVHGTFLPVGAATAEAVCVELAEDHQVFAVLNGFAGPGAESVNECFGGLYDTILVGGKPTPEQLERITATWISDDISLGRRGRAFVNLLRETGRLADLGTFMLYGANGDYEATIADTTEALEAAGADVALATYNPSTGDEAATLAHMEVLLERARAEGVSTVFFIGEAAYAQEVLFQLGDEFTVLILNGDSTNRWKTDPPLGIEEAGTLLTNRSFTSSTDPAMADCLAIIEAGLGLEVRSVELLEEGEANYWSATQASCRLFEMFRQIAIAAGPDLTNESFAAAAVQLGSFSISGQPYNSLGPDKFDARDTLSLAEWDHGLGFWRAISEPVDVG
jgi:ABC-type branched-subunit amino acid transport system substrate-binding protein